MMNARFRFFHFPRSLSKSEKIKVRPCTACFAKWLLHTPSTAQHTPAPSLDSAVANAPKQAAEAILDWLETHGGEVRTAGPNSNLSLLADALSWSGQYLPQCGRLLPFLRKYGCPCPRDITVVVGMQTLR